MGSELNSKARILAAWKGEAVDHVPLTTWCFGLPAHKDHGWERDGVRRDFWYSLRMEHIHTLPQPWTLEDDFQRVLAWRKLGVDDILDVSVPWSADTAVTWKDSEQPAGTLDRDYPVLVREYGTPSGPLRHAVRKTGEEPGAGWTIQPDHVPLFEDFNIPRGVDHAVISPDDVGTIRHLYGPPDDEAREWFGERMAGVSTFTNDNGVPVQAWAGFGIDGVVWLTGVEGAIMLAIDSPGAFRTLMDTITVADLARTELAAAHPGVDAVVARGWYSSTDLWSPALFEEYVFPYVRVMADAVHRHRKVFIYTMTTGVETLGPRLADAGVDVLCFVDPVQDRITLESARDKLGGRMCLVGGINSTSLRSDTAEKIREDVRHAIEVLKPTGRFILHPLDAVFPDTPWTGMEAMIKAWEECR